MLDRRRNVLNGEDNTVYFYGTLIEDFHDVLQSDILFESTSTHGKYMCIRDFSTKDNGLDKWNSSKWTPKGICIVSAGEMFPWGTFVGVKKFSFNSNGSVTEANLPGQIISTRLYPFSVYENYFTSKIPSYHTPDTAIGIPVEIPRGSFPSHTVSLNYFYIINQIDAHNTYFWYSPNPSSTVSFATISPIDIKSSVASWYNAIRWDTCMYYDTLFDDFYAQNHDLTYLMDSYLGDFSHSIVSGQIRMPFFEYCLATTNLLNRHVIDSGYRNILNKHKNLHLFFPSMFDMATLTSRCNLYLGAYNKLKQLYSELKAVNSVYQMQYMTCDHVVYDNVLYCVSSTLVGGIWYGNRVDSNLNYYLPFFTWQG